MDLTKFNRFKDASWFPTEEFNNEYLIDVGGAGGISSWLSLLLTRAGFNIMVHDFDTIEEHNLGGQFFQVNDIGKLKVEALFNNIKLFTGTGINISQEKVTEETEISTLCFSGFDNMKARKDMFNAWKREILSYKDNKQLKELYENAIFIDGRLLMEQMQIFCVTPENMTEYEEKYLFEDSEIEDVVCTLKQTSHSATMIASHMVGFFTNHVTNILSGSKDRVVPFYYEYFIPIDYLNNK